MDSKDNTDKIIELINKFVQSWEPQEVLAWLKGRFEEHTETKEESGSIAEEVADGMNSGAEHVGVKAAVSGAIVVAAKKGWILSLENTTPVDIKVVSVALFMAAKGELTGEKATDGKEKDATGDETAAPSTAPATSASPTPDGAPPGSLAPNGDETDKYVAIKIETNNRMIADKSVAAVEVLLHNASIGADIALFISIVCIRRPRYKSQGTVRVETVPGERSNLIFVPDEAHSLKSNGVEHAVFVDWWGNGPNYSAKIIKLSYPAGNIEAIRNVQGVSIIIPDIFFQSTQNQLFQSTQNQLGISLLSSVLETQKKVEVTVCIIGSKVTLFGLALPAA